MSEKNNDNSNYKQAFDGYSRLILQQSEESAKRGERTNQKLESLIDVVQTLVITTTKSEERHKQYDDRFARIEDNEKRRSEESKAQNDLLIAMGKDLEVNKSKWSFLGKITISVLSSLALAAIYAIAKGHV